MPQNTGGPVRGWQIYEEDSYDRSVAALGSHEFFDRALAPVEYALHRNPLGFAEIPGFPGLYLAKTKLRLIGLEIVPSYRLWFRVNEVERAVAKLYVEIAPPEDMGLGESFWDEDEIPF